MPAEYDVFLSYNRRDQEAVRPIAVWLEDQGLKVWLDDWELRPGLPWQEGMAKGIAQSQAVAIFVGAERFGDWQKPEVRAFLNRAHKEGVFAIPVLLPGSSGFETLDLFLQDFAGVDLRPEITEEGRQRLLWGITGRKPQGLRRSRKGPPDRRPGTPFLHNLPYSSLGAKFKGRAQWLKKLHKSLNASASPKATAIAGKVIHGLGGVGKTRLAIEYAWRHAGDYRAAFFVGAQSPADLRRNLAALAEPELLNLPEQAATKEGVRELAVLRWLRENTGWLLILDNVDTEEAAVAVGVLLPKLQGGPVLLTGRISNWSAGVESIEIGLLAAKDAAAFLHVRTQGRRRSAGDDEERARQIAHELGYLPLALEQAGAYIAAQRLTFAAYQDDWESRRAKVLKWFDSRVSHYPASVAVTWQTSVDQLTEPARRLLRRLAWLGPEPIPESLLEVAVPGAEPGAEEPSPAELLVELGTYSLVTRSSEAPAFTVHRLVQEVTRQRSEAEAGREALVEALAWVDQAFDGDPQDVRTWPRLEPLAPHARALVTSADQAEIAEPTARLMNELAQLYKAKALLAEAEPLMRRLVTIVKVSHGEEHPNVAVALNNLALLLHATNRLDEAEPLMRRALLIGGSSFGAEYPYVAQHLNNLAQLLQDTNRIEEAEPLMRRALLMDENGFGAGHPIVAIRLSNLAALLQSTDRPDEAEPLMRRALHIDESSLGTEHPKVAIRLNNLAQLLKASNHLNEAEPLMRRVVAISEKSLGENHPIVATALNNLADLFQAKNLLAEAEPLMRRALHIKESTLGTDHPEVATVLNNLAQLLQATNRLDEAEPLMRRVVLIFLEFSRRTGHRHPHVEAAFGNYADLLQSMGRSESEIEEILSSLS